jgi:hypothetical protein
MTRILRNKSGWIGLTAALIGSLLFAMTEGITLENNDANSLAELIRSNFSWIILIFCVSSALSIIPGYLGGRIVERLKKTTALNNLSLIAIGAVLGIVAVVLISFLDLFVVLSAHNYWSIKNNPAFPVYVRRLVEVVIIAGLMGGGSGFLIAKS